MRRTVKAWGFEATNGSVVTGQTEAFVRAAAYKRRVFPCVVTYDDGRPAPRKRTKAPEMSDCTSCSGERIGGGSNGAPRKRDGAKRRGGRRG